MNIYIAADHRGIKEKKELMVFLKENNYNVIEIGNNSDFDDYTDFAFKLCEEVIKDDNSLGILICGNGIGMSIAANKVKGIRCARVVNTKDAFNAKNHNGANVIAIGADLDIDLLKDIVLTFIETDKANEMRHLNRISKIINYENGDNNEL